MMVEFDHYCIGLQIAREVLDAAARVVRPGITTDEIDAVVHEATIAAGTNAISHISKHLSLPGGELLLSCDKYDVL